MSEITIRHAEPSDVDGIRALYAQRHAYADTLQLPYPSTGLWAERLTSPAPGTTYLVAESARQIAGQLTLAVQQAPRRKHVATLGMGVNADYRRMGVGTRLLEAALDMADRWLAVTRIEIEVYVDNEAAISLYERFGFEREGVARSYAFRDGAYVDVLLMARLRPGDDD